jgi:hypothetical protein
VRLGFKYPQAKPEPCIEIQRSIQKEYWKGPQLSLSSTRELKTSIRSESACKTNPDSASQTIGNTGARIIESSALMNSTVIHFVIDITSTLASLQRTLSEVSTADLFFGATLKAWEITNLPDTIPNYLAVKIDNARFSKVIRFGEPQGFEEVLHGIMAASCWAERVSVICVVEVRGF